MHTKCIYHARLWIAVDVCWFANILDCFEKAGNRIEIAINRPRAFLCKITKLSKSAWFSSVFRFHQIATPFATRNYWCEVTRSEDVLPNARERSHRSYNLGFRHSLSRSVTQSDSHSVRAHTRAKAQVLHHNVFCLSRRRKKWIWIKRTQPQMYILFTPAFLELPTLEFCHAVQYASQTEPLSSPV